MSFADKGSVLVTGANRGIGRSLVEALLKTKIRKVYAATRSLARLPDFSDDRVVGVKLDITNIEQVSDVVEQCQDINI